MPMRSGQREPCHSARMPLRSKEPFRTSPRMPAKKRSSVIEIVMGKTKLQISRTATETASPIQNVSLTEHSSLKRARTMDPMPMRVMAMTPQVKRISSAERTSIYGQRLPDAEDFGRSISSPVALILVGRANLFWHSVRVLWTFFLVIQERKAGRTYLTSP